MSEHLVHDDLLGYHLSLLEDEEREAADRHLAGCDRCRRALVEVGEMMGTIEDELPREVPSGREPVPWLRRLTESIFAPTFVMACAVVMSAVQDRSASIGAMVPLVIGAALVVLWLHGVVSRAASGWRSVGERDWRVLVMAGDEEALRRVEGVRLAALWSLARARRQVAQVLLLSGAMFIVSGAVTLLAGLWAPEVATQVASGRPLVLPGALALGVLLGGAVWASVRLARLGREVAKLMKAMVDEVERV